MEIDEDKIKGICKGTARMKIRLNEGETKEMVRQNLERVGIQVVDHQLDAGKKSAFTTPIY